MPNLIRAPLREVRNRAFDSTRWAGYTPRSDDIIIATYPKCGTTWTQRIVQMLVSQSAEPAPIMSPWFDFRFMPMSAEALHAMANQIPTRRYLKSHLPYDALPVYEDVKFIHVARDGRDSAMSFHNHLFNFTPQMLENADAISIADPKFGTPMPRAPESLAAYFNEWINGLDDMGDIGAGYFHVENSYWAARKNPNVLLVHYNDLKADRGGEMKRIADFLGIDVSPAVWPEIVEAASFASMRANGATIMQGAENVWEDGAKTFLHKGTNGRWQDVVSQDDLAAYAAKVKANFSPALAQWLENGRLVAGDPAATAD